MAGTMNDFATASGTDRAQCETTDLRSIQLRATVLSAYGAQSHMPKKTVSDVMQDVFEGSRFKCLPHEKRNLDEDPDSEYREYDSRIRGRMFENPESNQISKVPTTGVDEQTRTILTYFMDGSRRVFRFSDVILPDGRYYPVLAGQV